ncbi:type II secretion system F family protein [Luedemannella flava]
MPGLPTWRRAVCVASRWLPPWRVAGSSRQRSGRSRASSSGSTRRSGRSPPPVRRGRRSPRGGSTGPSTRVATLAAELRAGVPAEVAVRDCAAELTRDVAHRVAAAVTLAERTGAPLAAVLDRLDQQLRAALRLRSTVAAQAAGARASAWLLAVLPLAGVALGPVMGVSPGAVLLGTPLGAGCLLGAVALQLGGLAWAARLARPRGVTP